MNASPIKQPSALLPLAMSLAALTLVLGHAAIFGVMISVLGVLANAGASILGRDFNRMRSLHPLLVTAVSMGIGAIVLLVVGVAIQGLPALSLRSWAIIAWLAVVNTAVTFTLWNYILRTLSATESSILNGTMLIWIPILAVLFLGERLTTKEIIGLVVAGGGTLIVQVRYPGVLWKLFLRRAAG